MSCLECLRHAWYRVAQVGFEKGFDLVNKEFSLSFDVGKSRFGCFCVLEIFRAGHVNIY